MEAPCPDGRLHQHLCLQPDVLAVYEKQPRRARRYDPRPAEDLEGAPDARALRVSCQKRARPRAERQRHRFRGLYLAAVPAVRGELLGPLCLCGTVALFRGPPGKGKGAAARLHLHGHGHQRPPRFLPQLHRSAAGSRYRRHPLLRESDGSGPARNAAGKRAGLSVCRSARRSLPGGRLSHPLRDEQRFRKSVHGDADGPLSPDRRAARRGAESR